MALFMYFPEGKTFYPSVPTLERIAAIKTAITLWNLSDIRATIKEQLAEFDNYDCPMLLPLAQWEKIEKKVKSYAEQLSLPQELMKEMFRFINAIGFEVLEYKEYQKYIFGETENYNVSMPNQLCWTAYGSIDVRKTVETLVKVEDLGVDLRYKVACTYCLEKDITELKDRVSDEVKDLAVEADVFWMEMHNWNCLVEEINTLEEIVQSRVSQIPIECCSIKQRIRDVKQHMRDKYDNLLYTSIESCNKPAVEYIMTGLPLKHEGDYLRDGIDRLHGCILATSHCKFQSELLFFLYAQEREKYQPESYEMSGFIILKCCLNWPWQDLFLPVANHFQTFIEEGLYDNVLIAIVKNLKRALKIMTIHSFSRKFGSKALSNIKCLP